MTKALTRKLFRQYVHKRWRLEKRLLTSRIDHWKAMREWKGAYFDMIWWAGQADWKDHKKQAMKDTKRLRAILEKAAQHLLKREREHREHFEISQLDFHMPANAKYERKDFMPKGASEERMALKRAWAMATRSSVRLEVFHVNFHLKDCEEE